MRFNNNLKKFVLLNTILLILLLGTGTALAASVTNIGDLDLNSGRDLSGKGYYWDASEQTLTLENVKLEGMIILPDDGDVTVCLKGENVLTVPETHRSTAAIYTDSRQHGQITFESDGTGSLIVNGEVNLGWTDTLTIMDCILSVSTANYQPNQSGQYSMSAGTLNTVIKNARLYFTDGMNLGGNHMIDNSFIEIRNANSKLADVDVNGSLTLKNGSELQISFDDIKHASTSLQVDGDFFADQSSVVEILNPDGTYAMHVDGRIELLSHRLLLTAAKSIIYTHEEAGVPASIILPAKLSFSGSDVSQIDYASEEYEAKLDRIKSGVEATTIKLQSARTARGNIKLTWRKSPGYRVDYYEVFRSTKRYSGYTKKPFYTTTFDKKTTYTNTGSLQKGTRYYYKVRGVRTIDGEKYYTQWSNKAIRSYVNISAV